MSEYPDPNAGDSLAYDEAWESRLPDDDESAAAKTEQDPEDPPNE